MATFDVRDESKEEITEIVFADICSTDDCYQAHIIVANVLASRPYITIGDSEEAVIVCSKEHAQNLIKALNKAIELGWLE